MKTRLAAILFACACGAPTPATVTVVEPLPTASQKPVVIAPHQPPTMSAFIAAGCHDEKPDTIDCTNANIQDVAMCREPLYIQRVTLDPAAAVVMCYADMRMTKEGIRQSGCMLQSHVHVLAATATGIVHITTTKQFVTMFAPVTSAEEATAFAVLLTGDAAYDKPFSPPPGSTIHVAGSQVTRPVADGDAFTLRLFHGQMCGCSHPLSGVDYRVARDGTVTESARAELWEDPKSHGLCVD